MENKNNKGVIALLIVIIVILTALCVLFATGTITLNSNKIENNNQTNVENNDENNNSELNNDHKTGQTLELKNELTAMNHGSNEDELVEYQVYIKNNKLYAKKLKTNEEKIVFEQESVKKIATRTVCCAGGAFLLILTDNGNVYISKEDSNYNFSFNISFEKLEAKNIVSFQLIDVASDYSTPVQDLYGIDSNGNEILLHKMS